MQWGWRTCLSHKYPQTPLEASSVFPVIRQPILNRGSLLTDHFCARNPGSPTWVCLKIQRALDLKPRPSLSRTSTPPAGEPFQGTPSERALGWGYGHCILTEYQLLSSEEGRERERDRCALALRAAKGSEHELCMTQAIEIRVEWGNS